MTWQIDGTDAVDARGSRAINQQKAIEDRFGQFLTGNRLLNIGSGAAPMFGAQWWNVDNSSTARAEYYFNIAGPWPIIDNYIDAITAIHVLEHFTGDELFRILWEAGRVLKPSGSLVVVVPHGLNAYHYSNPFHKFAWTEETPFHFDRRRYEEKNTQSEMANQGKQLHAWSVSNMTFVPAPEWLACPEDKLREAMHTCLNVISELSFVMTLEEK